MPPRPNPARRPRVRRMGPDASSAAQQNALEKR
jgi:hypothetical protein